MSDAPESAERDNFFMSRALELALEAQSAGEVPVGAVIVKDGVIVGEGWNRPISTRDDKSPGAVSRDGERENEIWVAAAD